MTGSPRLPGDPSPAERVEQMIRVDHAGEYGAVRIYEGQLAVLGNSASAGVIREMADQERRHLERFEKLVREHRVRPTALSPLWHVAGYAMGAASALLGERAAMACTVAVEEVIDEHYRAQAESLGDDPEQAPLRQTIEEFRADELAHRDIALAHDARTAPAHDLLTAAVKLGSRVAIWLSTRI